MGTWAETQTSALEMRATGSDEYHDGKPHLRQRRHSNGSLGKSSPFNPNSSFKAEIQLMRTQV